MLATWRVVLVSVTILILHLLCIRCLLQLKGNFILQHRAKTMGQLHMHSCVQLRKCVPFSQKLFVIQFINSIISILVVIKFLARKEVPLKKLACKNQLVCPILNNHLYMQVWYINNNNNNSNNNNKIYCLDCVYFIKLHRDIRT